mmetsp:Transcript_3284/g.6558  ORF Transcript_3284/g.6558 Transcript_3284/m.6558 type:complete len:289 (+) Transcript_3284:333-1199(+)
MIHNSNSQLHLQGVSLEALHSILQLHNGGVVRDGGGPLFHLVFHLIQLLRGDPELNSQVHHSLIQPIVLLANLLQLRLLSLVVSRTVLELGVNKCLFGVDPLKQRSQLRPQLLQLRLGGREGLLNHVLVLLGLGQMGPPLLGVRWHCHPQLGTNLFQLDSPLVGVNLRLHHFEVLTVIQGLFLFVDHLTVDHLLLIVVEVGILFVDLLDLGVAVHLRLFSKPLVRPLRSLEHHLLLLQCLFAQRMQHLADGFTMTRLELRDSFHCNPSLFQPSHNLGGHSGGVIILIP